MSDLTASQYPQWLGRRDKRGIPLFLFEVAPLNTKNISAYEKNLAKSRTTVPNVLTKNVRLFALYESLTRYVTPLCSMVPRSHPETPISQSNNIVDISGVGLKQFWNLKGHMQDASVLATAHYPETLDRIFVRRPRGQNDGRLIQTDRRCTRLLPHRLGLDQALVRSHYCFEDLHSLPSERIRHPVAIHRPREHPKEIRRWFGL
jgi:hypothetical protein